MGLVYLPTIWVNFYGKLVGPVISDLMDGMGLYCYTSTIPSVASSFGFHHLFRIPPWPNFVGGTKKGIQQPWLLVDIDIPMDGFWPVDFEAFCVGHWSGYREHQSLPFTQDWGLKGLRGSWSWTSWHHRWHGPSWKMMVFNGKKCSSYTEKTPLMYMQV